MGELQDERQSAAAQRCVEAIIAAGTTRLGVEELREAAGISKRTFHRYFPAKAQAIRPYFADMTARLTTRAAATDHRNIETWKRIWADVVLGPQPERSLRLFRLIRADPSYWSVFLEVVEDGERLLAAQFRAAADGAVRPRAAAGMHPAGLDPAGLAAAVSAVAIVAASRLALLAATESGVDPVAAFEAHLRALNPPML